MIQFVYVVQNFNNNSLVMILLHSLPFIILLRNSKLWVLDNKIKIRDQNLTKSVQDWAFAKENTSITSPANLRFGLVSKNHYKNCWHFLVQNKRQDPVTKTSFFNLLSNYWIKVHLSHNYSFELTKPGFTQMNVWTCVITNTGPWGKN